MRTTACSEMMGTPSFSRSFMKSTSSMELRATIPAKAIMLRTPVPTMLRPRSQWAGITPINISGDIPVTGGPGRNAADIAFGIVRGQPVL
jgi:hypothetical protein